MIKEVISETASLSKKVEVNKSDNSEIKELSNTTTTISLKKEEEENNNDEKQNEVLMTANRLQQSAAICCIQKGALRYIDEWVDYHLALGFQQILIYDNSDDFETEEWHKEDRGNFSTHVVVKHWVPGVDNAQRPAYDDCIKSVKAEPKDSRNYHDWLAFIDLDEFIVLKKHKYIMELFDSVKPDAGGLSLNEQEFHYSNQTEYKPLPVTKRFQWRSEITDKHVKTIGKTEQIRAPAGHPHNLFYHNNKKSVDTNGNEVGRALNFAAPTDTAVIHHFKSKSLEEFMTRCKRGTADGSDELNKGRGFCRSKEEILEEWTKSGPGEFDDRAWQMLKERLPKYARLDNEPSSKDPPVIKF